jgi:hypothetical protein
MYCSWKLTPARCSWCILRDCIQRCAAHILNCIMDADVKKCINRKNLLKGFYQLRPLPDWNWLLCISFGTLLFYISIQKRPIESFLWQRLHYCRLVYKKVPIGQIILQATCQTPQGKLCEGSVKLHQGSWLNLVTKIIILRWSDFLYIE